MVGFEYGIGTRVVIVKAAGLSLSLDLVAADPTPAAIGKRGTIVEMDPLKIQLDDESFIYGYECWWILEKDEELFKELADAQIW